MMVLGFQMLIDPLTALYPAMSDYWLVLVLPLLLAISVVYKGTRIKELRRLAWETLTMTAQIVLLMIVAAGILQGVYWVWIRVN